MLKRIVLILIVFAVIFITSCSNPLGYMEDLKQFDLYYGDFGAVNGMHDVYKFVFTNLEYELDTVEYWMGPEETLNKGIADCEDYAILMINILYVELGVEANMHIIYIGDGMYHAIIGFDGDYYDSISIKTFDSIDIVKTYSFRELFY